MGGKVRQCTSLQGQSYFSMNWERLQDCSSQAPTSLHPTRSGLLTDRYVCSPHNMASVECYLVVRSSALGGSGEHIKEFTTL